MIFEFVIFLIIGAAAGLLAGIFGVGGGSIDCTGSNFYAQLFQSG